MRKKKIRKILLCTIFPPNKNYLNKTDIGTNRYKTASSNISKDLKKENFNKNNKKIKITSVAILPKIYNK